MPRMDETPDDLVTVNQGALRAKVHVNSVRRWEWRGEIRGWLVRGQLYVSLAEVLARAGPRRRTPRAKDARLDETVRKAVNEKWVNETLKRFKL